MSQMSMASINAPKIVPKDNLVELELESTDAKSVMADLVDTVEEICNSNDQNPHQKNIAILRQVRLIIHQAMKDGVEFFSEISLKQIQDLAKREEGQEIDDIATRVVSYNMIDVEKAPDPDKLMEKGDHWGIIAVKDEDSYLIAQDEVGLTLVEGGKVLYSSAMPDFKKSE